MLLVDRRMNKRVNSANSETDKASDFIETQVHKQGIRRTKDVRNLFLCYKNLSDVPNLHPFTNLSILWLASNRLRNLNFISSNIRLKELYAQQNEICDISGLKKISGLQVLCLHCNQLRNISDLIDNLKSMVSLRTLSLFSNPVCQEENYFSSLAKTLPSLERLDRHALSVSVKRFMSPSVSLRHDLLLQTNLLPDSKPTNSNVKTKSSSGDKKQKQKLVTNINNVSNGQRNRWRSFDDAESALNSYIDRKSWWEANFFDWNCMPLQMARKPLKPVEEDNIQNPGFLIVRIK